MKKNNPTFSVLIPAYKSEGIIGDTIKSVLAQTCKDLELIVYDDCSPDNTERAIKRFKDKRIKYFRNKKNLGYSKNLEECRKKARGKYIYLMGNDDIISKTALEQTLNAFNMNKDVGVVTRPYYWFEDEEIDTAVRVVRPLDKNNDRIVGIFDSPQTFSKVFESAGQLSCLAYRRKWMDQPIHKDIFPAHIYPFLSIFKKHKCVFLKDYILAVRIMSSQTRSLSSIYEPSPTLTWVNMFKRVLRGKKYDVPRKWGIDHIARNHEGLVQMKNYARFPLFFKEIWYLTKFRPKNLLNPKFWFYAIGLTITPKFIVISAVDYYKKVIASKRIENVELYNGKDDSKKTSHKYDKLYYEDTGMSGFESTDRMDHKGIVKYSQIKKSDNVLEIGCGMGELLSKLPAKKKYGIESNQFAVDYCKKRKLTVKKHDNVYKLPYRDKFFDVIILNEVIEHIPNPKRALIEINRILKNGGKLIMTTPNKNILVNNLAESHCSEMSYKELSNLVNGSGYEIMIHKVRGINVWDYLGRKIIFPVGRFLTGSKLLSNSVNNIRSTVDNSNFSLFRDNFSSYGSQQLLIARKKKK